MPRYWALKVMVFYLEDLDFFLCFDISHRIVLLDANISYEVAAGDFTYKGYGLYLILLFY